MAEQLELFREIKEQLFLKPNDFFIQTFERKILLNERS